MRLVSLNARNYRTLHDIRLQFAEHYCTISGRNNAGKSSVIRLLSALFRSEPDFPWGYNDFRFDYKDDKTQWIRDNKAIQVNYVLELTRAEDPALITFIEKIAGIALSGERIQLSIDYSIAENDVLAVVARANQTPIDEKAAKEIDRRIKESKLLFLYNSTTRHEEYYYGRQGRRRMFYDFIMSEEEKKELEEAGKHVDRRLKRLARQHKEDLTRVLGRLSERYDVEFSTPEGAGARRMPLGINLTDRNVEVPLGDWGSGTQNRTHILMAILQANRIKTTDAPDEKITPFVVIEEPESFLHPSAQSEFGRILRALSTELGIQIIVTTHSPYLLNQEEPASNLLLCREIKRKRAHQTFVVDTSGDNWMAPFSDHLGITSAEFSNWRPIFSSYKTRVLLVEGPIDQEYLQLLQKNDLQAEKLNAEIEVVPYGGKDTLKNTLLVQFVLRKFDAVFITYDLDADREVRASLSRLGLKENKDFLPVGINQAGKDCIEGLLPQRVLSTVNGRETDLVMKLGSGDSAERKRAKEMLKKKYLEEFQAHTNYSKEELKEMSKLVKIINNALCKSTTVRRLAS
jgi:putative ATP-dependent endonuclease of the OLD family